MKYIHGFLTSRLREEKISHDESLVIRYILNFINSNKMEKILVDGEFYYWIKYEKIVSDLDILGIKKQALSDMMIYDLGVKPLDWEDRLHSMSESSRKKKSKSKFIGIFKRYTKKDSEGTKSYFAPTDKLYSLLPNITEDDCDMLPQSKKAVTAGTDTTNSNSKNNNSNNSIPQKQDNDTRKSKKNNFGNNYQNKPKNKNGIKCVNDTFKQYEADELEKKLLQSQKGKFEDRIKIPIAKEKEDITEDYWNMN
jgi:hypothetical protein